MKRICRVGAPTVALSLLLAGCGGGGGGGSTNNPNPTPTTETVIFAADRGGNSEIFRAVFDGANIVNNPTNLTNHAGSDIDPSYSPNRNRVVFASNRRGSFEIYVMDANNPTTVTRITDRTEIQFNDDQPSIADDAQGTIVFRSSRTRHPVGVNQDWAIYRTNLAGAAPVEVTDRAAFTGFNMDDPAVSPNGQLVAFTSSRNEQNQSTGGQARLYIVGINGNNTPLKMMTLQGNVTRPVFSPNGQTIMFTSTRNGIRQLWTIAVNGAPGSETQVATFPNEAVFHGTYSQDGNEVAFVTTRGTGITVPGSVGNIYLKNLTQPAQAPRQVTTGGTDTRPGLR